MAQVRGCRLTTSTIWGWSLPRARVLKQQWAGAEVRPTGLVELEDGFLFVNLCLRACRQDEVRGMKPLWLPFLVPFLDYMWHILTLISEALSMTFPAWNIWWRGLAQTSTFKASELDKSVLMVCFLSSRTQPMCAHVATPVLQSRWWCSWHQLCQLCEARSNSWHLPVCCSEFLWEFCWSRFFSPDTIKLPVTSISIPLHTMISCHIISCFSISIWIIMV